MTLPEKAGQQNRLAAEPHVPVSPPAEAVPAVPSSPAVRRYAPVLDLIRILAVLGVVCVHVLADHLEPSSPIVLHMLRSLLSTAVPTFLMISGALNLAPAALRHGSGRFLGRRLRRLLPATVVWTAFYLLVMNVLVPVGPVDWREQASLLVTAETYPHLYFLPLIIGLTLISPVLATYVGDSGRRAWVTGAVCALWALVVIALPFLTEGLLGEAVVPLPLGSMTYFLPYIGYYVLGRAAWAAPVSRRTSMLLLLIAVPALTAATTWAYRSPVTQTPPGQALLPTYLTPTVMLLALALVIAVMALGRGWRASAGMESALRTLGDATFGVFLAHFAILVALRGAGFPEGSLLAVLALIVVVAMLSTGFTLMGKRIPGLRTIL